MITTPFNRIAFFDIETAAEESTLDQLSERKRDLWQRRYAAESEAQGIDPDQHFQANAAFHAEFAKMVAFAVGIFASGKLYVASVCDPDEIRLLQELGTVFKNLEKHGYLLSGHNVKEFDNPFCSKRYLINRLRIPGFIFFGNKKPWEINVIDTKELWRFGSLSKHNTVSLDLIAACLDIESPKADMDGSKVGCAYRNAEYEAIGTYCGRDIIALARVIAAFSGLHPDPISAIHETDAAGLIDAIKYQNSTTPLFAR